MFKYIAESTTGKDKKQGQIGPVDYEFIEVKGMLKETHSRRFPHQ